jgi:hypothetical protein
MRSIVRMPVVQGSPVVDEAATDVMTAEQA